MNKEKKTSDKGHNGNDFIADVSSSYINWLLKRINITENELEQATELNLKIGKGAKLCVYKECLQYITTHP